ncbi:MAG: hypothetical protein Q9160_007850 [Pyrenula sp. 1 TL-2023]
MALKRKRSFTTLSSPSSTSSHLPISPNGLHPQSQYFQTNAPFSDHTLTIDHTLGYSPPESYIANGMLLDQSNGSPGFVEETPSYLPSRTRKRFRDNRPDEASVHSHTLNILFSAQQKQPPHLFEQGSSFNSHVQTSTTVNLDHGMLTPSPTPAHSRLPSEPCPTPFTSPSAYQRRTSSSSLPSSNKLNSHIEPGQKTLHSFFPSDPSSSTSIKRPSSAHIQSTPLNALFSPKAAAAAALSPGEDAAMAMDLEPSGAVTPFTSPTRPFSHCSGCDVPLSPPAFLSTSFNRTLNPSRSHQQQLPFNTTTTFPPTQLAPAPEASDSGYGESISMMDVDDSPSHLEKRAGGCLHLQHPSDVMTDEFACSTCGRSVCDMCAVRGGEWRSCLECAGPGSGFR